MNRNEAPRNAGGEGPPLGSWTRVYLLVCATAVTCIALLYWLTVTFNLPLTGS